MKWYKSSESDSNPLGPFLCLVFGLAFVWSGDQQKKNLLDHDKVINIHYCNTYRTQSRAKDNRARHPESWFIPPSPYFAVVADNGLFSIATHWCKSHTTILCKVFLTLILFIVFFAFAILPS